MIRFGTLPERTKFELRSKYDRCGSVDWLFTLADKDGFVFRESEDVPPRPVVTESGEKPSPVPESKEVAVTGKDEIEARRWSGRGRCQPGRGRFDIAPARQQQVVAGADVVQGVSVDQCAVGRAESEFAV